jgi:hypothetical protein
MLEEGTMDEELSGQAPDHEPVPAGAAGQVAARAATAIQPGRMPAVYLGHGAPQMVDDPPRVVQLEGWAQALPRPSAILVVPRIGRTRPWRSAQRPMLRR